MNTRAEKPVAEFPLVHRVTAMCEEEGVTNETSLYFCTLTGLYILEQVRTNKNGQTTEMVSIEPDMLRSFLPHFQRIVDEG
jgi:hypothetical protein